LDGAWRKRRLHVRVRPALGSALTLLIAVRLVAVATIATADSSITIKLTRVNGVTSTEQGTAFPFKVTATNSGATEKVSIFIQLTSPTSATEDVRSWTPTVPGGGSVSRQMSEVSSQWFEETGSFSLVAKVDGAVTGNALTYAVTTATVTVPTFQDDTASLALDTVLPSDVNTSHAAGACWGDVNNDGHIDLFVPVRDGPAQLWVFHAETGTFQDEAAAWGVTNSGGKGVSCLFADYNNDGAEDLYVVNDAIDPVTLLPTAQGNVLYRNEFAQGQAKFTDVSASAGVGTQGNGASASWGDYDGDGYLDLYTVTNNAYNIESHGPYITYYQQDHLFHNDGDGTFTDVTCDSLPANDPNSGFCPGNPAMGGSTGSGFQAVWIDYNLDGRVDLYLGQDDLKVVAHNDINRLYRNDGYDSQSGQWKFTDVCAEDPTRAECLKIHSMGIAVGDFNNDLWPDLAISNTAGGGGNILRENNGDGTFTQVSA